MNKGKVTRTSEGREQAGTVADLLAKNALQHRRTALKLAAARGELRHATRALGFALQAQAGTDARLAAHLEKRRRR